MKRSQFSPDPAKIGCLTHFLKRHKKLKNFLTPLFQSLLVAQQLASAVSGVMSGGAPGLNQPILIPFNAGGHLGGQQGLVLSLPTAANIQGLVAAAAAGGIMTLPLQNLQGMITVIKFFFFFNDYYFV